MAIEAGTKFLGIASGVDTKERRSKQINDKSEYHTIEDIAAAATAGIVFPDPVDADTIVGQLDAENFEAIEAGLQGKIPYEQTIIRIDNFSTSAAALTTWETAYTNKNGGVTPATTPFVNFDGTLLTWFIDTSTAFSADHRYTCNVYQYAGGQTIPPTLVTAEFDSSDVSKILIVIYDQSFQPLFAETTTNHLQFGLEINIYNF